MEPVIQVENAKIRRKHKSMRRTVLKKIKKIQNMTYLEATIFLMSSLMSFLMI
jgi:hypothetical protein